MSKIQEIKSYTPPILHTGKDWYIDFYAFNPVDGVMKRKKIKLNFIKSVKERRHTPKDASTDYQKNSQQDGILGLSKNAATPFYCSKM